MAKIQSELILNSGRFQSGLKTAQSSLRNFGSAAGGLAAKVSGIFAVIQTAALTVGLKKAFDVGGALSDLSAATGAAVGDLVVLQQAFADAGLGADAVGPAVARMQRNISEATQGNKELEDAFNRLGISANQLSNLGAADQMKVIGDAIMAIENPTARAGAAMDIFGKKGAQMLALFANGTAIDSAANAVGNQAQILDKNANLFDDISDKLAQTGLKVQGFFVGVAERVAPVLKPLLDGFSTLDLSGLGQQVGDVIAFLVQAFSSGQIGTILGASIEVAIKNAANGIVSFLSGLGTALGQVLVGAIRNAVEFFSIIREPQFWAGLGNTLIGLAQGFVAALLDGVGNMIDALRNVPLIGERIGNASEGIRQKAAGIRNAGQANRAEGIDDLSPFIAQAKDRMMDALGNIGAAFQDGAAGAPRIFDATDAEGRLGNAIDSVFAAIEQNRQAAESLAATPKTAIPPIDTEESGGKGRASFGPVFAQTLAKVGGGGVSVGGGPDPLLEETRRQSSLLQQIARNTTPKPQPKSPLGLTSAFA